MSCLLQIVQHCDFHLWKNSSFILQSTAQKICTFPENILTHSKEGFNRNSKERKGFQNWSFKSGGGSNYKTLLGRGKVILWDNTIVPIKIDSNAWVLFCSIVLYLGSHMPTLFVVLHESSMQQLLISLNLMSNIKQLTTCVVQNWKEPCCLTTNYYPIRYT